MHYDFNTVANAESQTPVPTGTYICRVTEVQEKTARDGSPRWVLRLQVAAGEYAGRLAGWDSITWSPRGVHRVQLVLCALGIDARGEVELEASELLGLKARVRFELEERENTVTGQRRLYLSVPYAGFEPLDGSEEDEAGGCYGDNGSAGIDAEGGDDESSGDGPSLQGVAG
ncbi:MAG: DUF669 domain-containing protein, partial [Planctomycetes bacterium]|nr:DUF669 domain-containing protein [Planctomycetota bacterium]